MDRLIVVHYNELGLKKGNRDYFENRLCLHIRAVLESTNWRIRGAGGAAERLGLKPTTLESRMARFGLRRKTTAPAAVAPAES